jgi:hypothetical protein
MNKRVTRSFLGVAQEKPVAKQILTIGNYDLAGTSRFITHMLTSDEKKTLCGLIVSNLRGDWQETDGNTIGCLKCRSIYRGKFIQEENQL